MTEQEQIAQWKAEHPECEPGPTLSEQEIEEFRIGAALRSTRLYPGKDIWLKVSPKGGVSVYGLWGRFPVTLYPSQWSKLLANGERESYMTAQ